MLHRLVPLARGLGVPVGWQVIGGPPEFFAVTKRLCDRLYGVAGDGGASGFESSSSASKRTPGSSNVQKRGFGMPAKSSGAGMRNARRGVA